METSFHVLCAIRALRNSLENMDVQPLSAGHNARRTPTTQSCTPSLAGSMAACGAHQLDPKP